VTKTAMNSLIPIDTAPQIALLSAQTVTLKETFSTFVPKK